MATGAEKIPQLDRKPGTQGTAAAGCTPADSPPEEGAIAGEGLEGLEALHEVVEVRPADSQLGRVALPQDLMHSSREVDAELSAS